MFGHDNQDNNDSQIMLPPAGDPAMNDNTNNNSNTDTNGNQDNQSPAPQNSNDPLAAAPATPRKTPKSGAPTDDLLDIKQDALQALTPLVDHLDQTPEEKFRTTMMMIQASDNHGLIKVAYEAAQHIASEKERAQALLDIVNEINYFTQQQQA
jgi:hypothetical protein